MKNKFISRDALRKRKAKENESSSKREIRLAKQREYELKKNQMKNLPEKYSRYNESRLEFIMTIPAAKFSGENATTKKFSAENNMDLGKVLDELWDLAEIEKMLIVRHDNTFLVPILPSSDRKNIAIQNSFNRMQENHPITWPQINNNPINEFQMAGYIACAFPSLYSTESADFCAEHIRDIKPAKYFRHLLLYKDGRFTQHTHWRYFALNS
ncbi:uncharacterized protein LOC105316640 [Rhizophagus clarus]|uniref:Uncharacterized protein LOC105316640 n=1 Tax=Rhizophagus clarus TaxID=94130 RepID=A0A8H3L6N2_9GLOM|nr:uncharacterized protein LOC105316640 [Rhizophagus clarus]